MPFLKYLEIILQYLISLVKLFFITPTIKFLSFFNKSIALMLRDIYLLAGGIGRNTLKVNSSDNLQKTNYLSHKSVQYSGAKTKML
jgi:hypothetical protein